MKYLIIGLGNTGLSILSALKNDGCDVLGFNRPGKSLRNLDSLDRLHVEGIINSSFKKDFIVDDLKKALEMADFVFICVPQMSIKT